MTPFKRWLIAGTATAVVDFLWACVLSAGFYGSTVTRLWQGVAATVLGKSAFDGGMRTVLIGLAMHVCVAFFWSGVLLLLALRSAWVRRVLSSPAGVFGVAVVWGPYIWMVMSILVIPMLVHRSPTIGTRWWIQLAGHVFFVGLPMTIAVARTRPVAR